nr:YqaJ viral recombinase family protein [uncultured Albidiferax sp.]
MAIPQPTDKPPRQKPALKLVKTQDLSRDQWLSVRKGGIGSSDAGSAVGLNPYKSQLELWMEKTGRDGNLPKTDPNDETSPMYWGNLLEPIVAAHYTKRTGNKVRRINAVLQHPREPWMLANLDREVVGVPDVQILECKTAGINGARLWKEGVPEYIQLQVMHQLAVTGKQAADVAVLICGQELQVQPCCICTGRAVFSILSPIFQPLERKHHAQRSGVNAPSHRPDLHRPDGRQSRQTCPRKGRRVHRHQPGTTPGRLGATPSR